VNVNFDRLKKLLRWAVDSARKFCGGLRLKSTWAARAGVKRAALPVPHSSMVSLVGRALSDAGFTQLKTRCVAELPADRATLMRPASM
jgi:hypothetical protein